MSIHDEQKRVTGDARAGDLMITVRSGIHSGASARIADDRIMVIGSVQDCDIRLFDSEIRSRHALLNFSEGSFVLRALEGDCAINGRETSAGSLSPVRPGDTITLGSTEIAIDDVVDHSAETLAADKAPKRPDLPLRTAVTALLVLVSLASTVFFVNEKPIADPVEEVRQMVAAVGVTDFVSVSADNGSVTLRGIVPDDRYADLEAALADLSRGVINQLQPTSMLLEQVRSVFRTNGYHVELEYVGDGGVQVKNLDGSNAQVEQVAARVRNDVPAVSSLTFLPIKDSEPPVEGIELFFADPQKRLTTIVDGDTAYVAAADGGRYFVGSILPGGFVLRRITEGGIQVDDNGEIRWLGL